MGVLDGLNKNDSMFGVTVRGFDNNKIILGRPTPYGTAMGLYFQSVGLKGYSVYNEAANENK